MALDPVTAGIDLAKTVVSTIWPDKSAQEQAQLAAALALVQGQMDINKVEAGSADPFTSRWRPAIGWICGAGLGIQFIVNPIATWIAALAGHPIAFPTLDLGTLLTLLFGMLGLGAMRSIDKKNGVAS